MNDSKNSKKNLEKIKRTKCLTSYIIKKVKDKAIEKTCLEKEGQRVSLFDHMRTVWDQI